MATSDICNIARGLQASAERYSTKQSFSDKKALLDAIRQLQTKVETPEERVDRIRGQVFHNICVVMAHEMGILDVLVANKGSEVSCEKLAKEIPYDLQMIGNKFEADAWMRILRCLNAIGIGEETGPQTYKSNPMAEAMAGPTAMAGFKMQSDFLFPIASQIRRYLHEPGLKASVDFLQDTVPFDFTFGKPMWRFLRDTPPLRAAFDALMAGRNKHVLGARWHERYPAAAELGRNARSDKDAVLLVDVGGNHGQDVGEFRKDHPELPGRCVLQDLPETLELIPEGQPAGVEHMAYDFFTAQPVKGARAYYFHTILHDWSDRKCREILSNTARVMEKGYSSILIDEIVLADTGESIIACEQDIGMMLLPGGLERSLLQWKELLASTDPPLEFVEVYSSQGAPQCVIEARLAG